MKKLWSFLIAVFVVFGMAACGDDGGKKATTPDDDDNDRPPISGDRRNNDLRWAGELNVVNAGKYEQFLGEYLLLCDKHEKNPFALWGFDLGDADCDNWKDRGYIELNAAHTDPQSEATAYFQSFPDTFGLNTGWYGCSNMGYWSQYPVYGSMRPFRGSDLAFGSNSARPHDDGGSINYGEAQVRIIGTQKLKRGQPIEVEVAYEGTVFAKATLYNQDSYYNCSSYNDFGYTGY